MEWFFLAVLLSRVPAFPAALLGTAHVFSSEAEQLIPEAANFARAGRGCSATCPQVHNPAQGNLTTSQDSCSEIHWEAQQSGCASC